MKCKNKYTHHLHVVIIIINYFRSLLGMPGMPRPGMPRPGMLGPGGMPPHAPPDMGIPAGMLPRMPPPGMLPPGLPMPPPMGVRPPHSPWSKHKTPDGREYYYNLQTMQSTWEKPKDLREEATEQAQGLPPGELQVKYSSSLKSECQLREPRCL